MVWDLARCLFPVTRKRPAMKRHLGRRISDLLLPTRAAGGGGVMVGGARVQCGAGRWKGRGTGDWSQQVASQSEESRSMVPLLVPLHIPTAA